MRLIWAGIASLLGPALRFAWLPYRAWRGKEDRTRLPERRGIDATPRPPGRLLWLHAASVGEAMSILPVLAALPPDVAVLLTTGSIASARLLARRLAELGLDARVRHRFVPLDVPRWAARFLDHWQPDAAGFVESEIWPNLLAACRARAIPVGLLNARLSADSFQRWRLLPTWAREVFGGFAWIAAQSEADAARLRALGADHVTCDGNLKYAAAPLPADAAELARLRAAIGRRPVWLAASTHNGEERIAVQTHNALAGVYPDLLTIIVPRHAERGAEIAAIGRPPFPRRSQGDAPPAGGIWIGDTMGEMGLYYRLAAIVFVGRSLIKDGGQNPLEPARLGCAVVMGPHGYNFREPVADLSAAGALQIVADGAELMRCINDLLRDSARVARMGQAGRAAASRCAELPALLAQRLLP